MIADFDQLRVYQKAFEVAMQIFERSKRWPKQEQYALTDQVRRSSRAVCSNISEAWLKRSYPKHFVSKLSDATSEAETITWLRFAHRCGYLSQPEAARLEKEDGFIIGGLVKMITAPEKWCSTASSVREPTAEYSTDV